VTADSWDATTEAVLDDARRAGANLTVITWADHGDVRRADDHRTLLADSIASPGVTTVTVPVARDDTALLVEAAGDVVAWGGLRQTS
jgi:hypothetical protein